MEARKVMVLPHSDGTSPQFTRLLLVMKKAGLKTLVPGKNSGKEELNALAEDCDIILLLARESNLHNKENSWEQAISSIQGIPLSQEKQVVVWCERKVLNKIRSSEQAAGVNSAQQIFPALHFLTHQSMLKLVDDLRSIHKDTTVEANAGICDITLIANIADDALLDKTSIILEGTRNIESIRVDSSDGKDYETLCSIALHSSRMVVILAAVASDWAVNFTRHVWKNNGGASSRTPLFVLFDKQYENHAADLKIPGVRVLLTEESMAGLEILVAFDSNMASVNE